MTNILHTIIYIVTHGLFAVNENTHYRPCTACYVPHTVVKFTYSGRGIAPLKRIGDSKKVLVNDGL